MAKKIIIISLIAIISLFGLTLYQWQHFYDGNLHIVFCNVGQGDGIFVRTPKGTDILIDGGPDESILSCLGNHMPFWDKTLELIVLSHPHADHLNGLVSVIQRYNAISFASEKLENNTAGFKELKNVLQSKKIKQRYLFLGDKIKTPDGLVFNIVGPSNSFITKTSPNGIIGESGEFASLETLLSFGSFRLLLTGDSQVEEFNEANLSNISVLQVPHHGSKTGLNTEIIKRLYPKLAVISVGRNKYGHPNREIIGKLQEIGARVLRTDEKGDIEIVSDGKGWFVNADK